MISALFINIKKWLQIYGYEVLDLILYPDNPDETDPRKRYNNFNYQFNHHVGTSEHFKMNHGIDYPYLAIDIECYQRSHCFDRYEVNFTVYYSTVSPASGRVCIGNTPEDKLEFRDNIHCTISNMLIHQVDTPSGIRKKTFADDVASLDNWYKPIRVQVLDIGCLSDFQIEHKDEVEMFSFPATLSVFTCL